jgi:hypothetical protein
MIHGARAIECNLTNTKSVSLGKASILSPTTLPSKYL